MHFLETIQIRKLPHFLFALLALSAVSTVSPHHASAQVVTLTPPDGMAGRGIMFTGRTYNSGPEVTGPTTSIFPNIFQIINTATTTVAIVPAGTGPSGLLPFTFQDNITGPYSFPLLFIPGPHKIRLCTNFDASTWNSDFSGGWGGSIPEANLGDNCGDWKSFTVYPTLTATCTPTSTGPPAEFTGDYMSRTYTYTVNASGGAGSYTYSAWSGTDGLTGAGTSITKKYTDATTIAKTASISVTSAGYTMPVNCSVTVYPIPDLMPTPASTVSITSANTPLVNAGMVGGTITFAQSISNTGPEVTGPATGFINNFQIRDSVPDMVNGGTKPGDTTIARVRAPATGLTSLNKDASQTVTRTYTIPSWLAPGTYYVRVCANMDTDGNIGGNFGIPEVDVGNNCGVDKEFTIHPSFTATCSVTSSGPPAGISGDYTSRTYTWLVESVVGGSGAYTYLWSDNSTASSLERTYTTAGQKTATVTVTSAGFSTAPACPVINVSTIADLTAGDTTPSATIGIGGTAETFTASVSNSGLDATGPTTASFFNMFQIANSASTTVAYVSATSGPANLAAGASVSGGVSGSYTFTASTLSQHGNTYYVRACANVKSNPPWTGSILEANYNNNCGAWKQITIYSDISASCAVAPTTGFVNETNFNWTLGSVTGGTGSYTYSWSGGPSAAGNPNSLSGTGTNVTKTYSTPGTATDAKTASITVSSGGYSRTFSCDNSASVVPRPDLTTGSVSPTSATTGLAKTFSATITNANASTGAGFTNLFQKAADDSGTGAVDIGTKDLTTLTSNGTATVSLSYTFSSAGTYYVRVCADKSSAGNVGVITESNESNNCGAWTAVTVSDAPPISATCSVSPTSGVTSSNFTWSVSNVTGGIDPGNYTYSWTGGPGTSDSLPGPTPTISKTYTSPGTKTGSVTISSGGTSQTFVCGSTNVCAAGSAWNGSSCVVGAFACTNLPARASPYPSPDDTGLTSNTVYTRSATDTAAKCQFECSSGYGWNATNSACTALPDLTASLDSPTAVAAAILALSGTTINFTATVSNVNAPTPPGVNFYNLFQTATALDSNGDAVSLVTDIGTFSSVPLPVGGTKVNPFNFTIPFLATSGEEPPHARGTASVILAQYTPPAPGTYYLRVCADKGSAGDAGAVTESNENNNCSAWKSVGASAAAPSTSGTLTVPASCTILSGASSCTVNATWTTANALTPQLVDANTTVILSTVDNQSAPGLQVWVANPSTVFNLQDGNTVLDTFTVTASCAPGTTWSGTACLANVAIGSFTPQSPNVVFNGNTALNYGGITGGGTITCTIVDQNGNSLGPISVVSGGGSKNSGALTTPTTFTLTCGNGVGPDVARSTPVTVDGALVNGVCAATHNSCIAGTSGNIGSTATTYTWSCAGANGGTTASCSEAKAAATLTASPTTINYSQSSTLSYSSSYTSSCSITNDVDVTNIAVPANTFGTTTVTPLVDTTYTLSCAGGGSDTVTVLVAAGQFNHSVTPASCTIFANASSCPVNLTWSSVNFSSPSIVNGAGSSLYTTANGISKSVSVKYGGDTFAIKNGTFTHDSISIAASCAPLTTWSGTACLANVAIGSFSPQSASIQNGQATLLTGSNITGGGTITCTIVDQNGNSLGPVSVVSGVVSKNSGVLTAPTTFTLTCGNGVGSDASRSTQVGVDGTLVNGACAATHNSCTAGTSGTVGSTAATYTWSCAGANGGTTASCSEAKAAPTASLSFSAGSAVSSLSVAYGDRVMLYWGSSNATICTPPSGNWSNAGTLSGSGLTNLLFTSTTFTFQCMGNGQTSPLQSVTVTVAANQEPAAPTITGPIAGAPSTSYNYTFTSVDPEGDTLHYEIDWDNNGSVDQTLPAEYVPSGTSQSQANNWASIGDKIFQARAVDVIGGVSAWTPYTVTLSCAPLTTWSGTACLANVAIGSFTPQSVSIQSGQSTTLTGSSITGGGTITCSVDNIPLSTQTVVSGNYTRGTPALTLSTTYTLTCSNGVGPDASKSTGVTVGGALVNGVCAATHNSCTAGTSGTVGSTATTYTWSCAGLNGGTTASCSEAKNNPEATLSTSPATINYSQSSTLTYTSSNTSSCSIDNGVGAVTANTTGTKIVSPLADTTYILACTGASDPATVLVAAGTIGVSTPSDSSCVISAGFSACPVNLTWSSVNFSSPSIVNGAGSSLYTTANGISKSVSVKYGGDTFAIKNGTFTHDSISVAASCAPLTTWSGTACLANVAIGSFTPQSASIQSGQSTLLTGSGITGGGTITCTIVDQNGNSLGPVSVVSGVASKSSGTLTTNSTFTLTCGNGVGPDIARSTSVAVGGALVNGVCAATHNSCTAGTSGTVGSTATTYTWSCAGANGGTTATCSEAKAAPTATLSALPLSVAYNGKATLTWTSTNAETCTAGGAWSNALNQLGTSPTPGSGLTDALTTDTTFTFQCTGNGQTTTLQSVTVTVGAAPISGTITIPSSCTIAAGASTCSVNATWTTANAGNPQFVDANTTVVLSSLPIRAAPFAVWVAFPATVFNLRNGATVLDTKTVGATCAAGSGWNGSLCLTNAPSGALIIPPSCVIPVGASTCVVEASWDLSDTNDAYLFDANPNGSGILFGKGRGYIPNFPGWSGTLPSTGHIDPPVNVAYPSTTFELKDGDGSTLSSQQVNASCASGSTWDGSVCLADVAIGSFTPALSSISSGQSTTLNGNNITGGGTITCSIDQGLGSVPVVSGNVSKSSGVLTTTTTFILTCGNGVGPNASKSTEVTVSVSCDANQGSACTSAANACGATNSGTIQCDGSCSAAAPSSASCPPSIPEISALWKGSTYFGPAANPSAPAYDVSGYQVKAQATSTGANINYYFEWSSDPSPTAQWSGWTGNGGWGSVTHYANYGPGTYRVQAWAVIQDPSDSTNYIWSAAPSAWLPVTLVALPPLAISCSGSPGNPYISQPVTWTSSVTGGSGAYSYSWSGDESLSGTASSVTKSYTSAGVKQATINITDTQSSQTGSATCVTGANQPNGPAVASTGGLGVSVGACTATLTVNPDQVEQGNNTSLTWSVTGGSVCASSCSGGLGFDTGGAISGANVPASVLPTPPTTAYSLTCIAGTYGPPAPANATVKVTIPAPAVTVNGQTQGGATNTGGGAGGSSVTGGSVLVDPTVANNVTIVWAPPEGAPTSGSNAFTSCSIVRNGTAWRIGLEPTGTITDHASTQTTYTVDCTNSTGTKHATRSILVNVLLNYEEF